MSLLVCTRALWCLAHFPGWPPVGATIFLVVEKKKTSLNDYNRRSKQTLHQDIFLTYCVKFECTLLLLDCLLVRSYGQRNDGGRCQKLPKKEFVYQTNLTETKCQPNIIAWQQNIDWVSWSHHWCPQQEGHRCLSATITRLLAQFMKQLINGMAHSNESWLVKFVISN